MADRALRWDACVNVRDLGGLPLERGGETRTGALVRSDSPHRLTAEGREALHAYGVRTVIDLRARSEHAREPNPFGAARGDVRYVRLPLMSEDALTAASGVADRAAVNAEILDRSRRNVGAIVRGMAEVSAGGIVFHCAVGKDRSGILAALLLELAGVQPDAIADDYAESEVRLRELRDGVIARAEPGERERLLVMWGAPRAAMLATLAHLERRHGGVERYLRSCGVGSAELRAVRSRLS